jgi:protein involved in polysaccharide export with SLBB domain
MNASLIGCRSAAWIVLLAVMWALLWGGPVRSDEMRLQRVPIATMETKISPGCVLNIVVDDEDELSHTYTVDGKGAVHFVIADSSGVHQEQWDVVLQGKNTAEAKAILTQSLGAYFKNPEVHVTIIRLPGLHVEIAGEVLRSGLYMLPYNSRVSDLLGLALTKPMADLTNILIRRPESQTKAPGAVKSFNIDFTTAAASDDSDDPKLEEGDKVYIRKMTEAPIPVELQVVRVVGEVKAPREVVNGVVQSGDGVAIPLAKDMKLKDVFERIGGLKETADRAHLYLGRLDGTTRVLNADKIESDDPEQNVKVRPGDLVIVPKRDRSQVFAVLGEVNAPNTFEYRTGEKVRLLQAIARAGDLSKRADHHRGVLSKGYLLDPTKARQIPFDPDLVKKGDQPNMELDPGDAVFIDPRKKRATIWQQLLPLVLHFLPF